MGLTRSYKTTVFLHLSVIRYRSCGPECESEAQLKSTWQCAVSPVFQYVTGENVSFVCNMTKVVPFCQLFVRRNVTFPKNMQHKTM